MPELAISIQSVTKRYQNRLALDISKIEVAEGSGVCLLGKNGSGKTTLIKAILNFIFIDTGQIFLFGNPHHEYSARDKLAFLPENFLSPYYLTGRDFLHYMRQLYNYPYTPSERDVVLQALDINEEILERPVRKLSKGMAQKLGLVSSLLSGRKLLILDEPLSGLDLVSGVGLESYLKKLKDLGITMFFSTHKLSGIGASSFTNWCDQIAILDHGKLLFLGGPDECCKTYQSNTLEGAYLASLGF